MITADMRFLIRNVLQQPGVDVVVRQEIAAFSNLMRRVGESEATAQNIGTTKAYKTWESLLALADYRGWRSPTKEEYELLLQQQVFQDHDLTTVDDLQDGGLVSIIVKENYVTGGPGWGGKLLLVSWDGSPDFVDVFGIDATGLHHFNGPNFIDKSTLEPHLWSDQDVLVEGPDIMDPWAHTVEVIVRRLWLNFEDTWPEHLEALGLPRDLDCLSVVENAQGEGIRGLNGPQAVRARVMAALIQAYDLDQ